MSGFSRKYKPAYKSKDKIPEMRIVSFVMNGKARKAADRDLWNLHLKNLKERYEFFRIS